MPAELLKDFGETMEPALEQGSITLTQAWHLTWALFVDEELTPPTHNLLRKVMLANDQPELPILHLH